MGRRASSTQTTPESRIDLWSAILGHILSSSPEIFACEVLVETFTEVESQRGHQIVQWNLNRCAFSKNKVTLFDHEQKKKQNQTAGLLSCANTLKAEAMIFLKALG